MDHWEDAEIAQLFASEDDVTYREPPRSDRSPGRPIRERLAASRHYRRVAAQFRGRRRALVALTLGPWAMGGALFFGAARLEDFTGVDVFRWAMAGVVCAGFGTLVGVFATHVFYRCPNCNAAIESSDEGVDLMPEQCAKCLAPLR